MLDITIIILTYNSSQVIKRCLESLNTNNYQIFLIDNASSDNVVSIVKQNFSSVKVIENYCNIGFGRANNIVLKKVKTKYALILNPDTIITDNAIMNCLEILSTHPEIALASPVIFNKQPENFINESVDKFFYTHFIVGGVLFVNMINLNKIGFFDEQFFMFAEDSDLSDRSISFGYKNAIINNCYAVHFGGQSSAKSISTIYLRFWHLGWSKTKYKQKRKNFFNFIRSSLRLTFAYFFSSIFYLAILKYEKAIAKFAFSFGCFSCLIGLKAFDSYNQPRGKIPFLLNKLNIK